MHVLISIFDFNFILMWFELCFFVLTCRKEGLKNEVLVKTRKNRGDKTRLSKIRTPPWGVRKFRTPFTLCEFHFCTTFQKLHALGPLCEFHRYANLVRTLCEFIFCANFQKPCSLSWRITGMRKFRTPFSPVRNSFFSLKALFSTSKT